MIKDEVITSLVLQLLRRELALPFSELCKRLLKEIEPESSVRPELKEINERLIQNTLSKLREEDFVRANTSGGGGDVIYSITGKGMLELEETRTKHLVERLRKLL
jgi:DNA-binding PadR family transcriptional regulator